MKKLNILVDLDGIVVDTCPTWLVRIYENTNVLAKMDDLIHWDLTDCDVFQGVKPNELFDILNEPGFTLSLPPMDGAAENLKKLHDAGHKLYFITARYGTNCMPETLVWMRKYLPWVNPEKQLGFFNDKFLIKGDVFIDDKAQSLALYRTHNPLASLCTIDYAHNRHETENVFRVAYNSEAWTHLREHIEFLALVENENIH